LLNFQGEIKAITKGSFELQNVRNGTMVATREMTHYLVIKKHLEQKRVPHYTYHPKSEKPIKAVMRHLPGNTPAADIASELLAMDFTLISVRQLSSKRPRFLQTCHSSWNSTNE
jgi:hypothetical protein